MLKVGIRVGLPGPCYMKMRDISAGIVAGHIDASVIEQIMDADLTISVVLRGAIG